MNLAARIRGWMRRRRRQRAARKLRAKLREFVYLDEVSVFSLLASRLGPLASDFTDTEANALKTEVQGTVGASAGVVKGETKSRLENTETRTSQVLRKATVQSHFKELYELEADNLGIGSLTEDVRPPRVRSARELQAGFGQSEFDGWLICESSWSRGQLFEIEVELSADAIYRMSSSLTAMVEIISGSPELFPASAMRELSTPTAINRVLDSMMVGLIPVRGRALDYKVVDAPGGKALAHVDVLRQVPDTPELNVRDLIVVGVTEQRLYWKDVRQVLYSDSRYKMLCRVSSDRLSDSWRPVKMVNLLGGLAPDLPRALSEFSESALSILSGAEKVPDSDVDRANGMSSALKGYARLIADATGVSLDPQVADDVERISEELSGSFEDHAKRRAAFSSVRDLLKLRHSTDIDADQAAYFRAIALTDAGLTIDAQPLLPAAVQVGSNTPKDEIFLDSEIVAIYW